MATLTDPLVQTEPQTDFGGGTEDDGICVRGLSKVFKTKRASLVALEKVDYSSA